MGVIEADDFEPLSSSGVNRGEVIARVDVEARRTLRQIPGTNRAVDFGAPADQNPTAFVWLRRPRVRNHLVEGRRDDRH